jgi:putative transposase
MARLSRLNLPNVPQHIVQRGNNRQVTFVEPDDYVVYLEKLKYYAKSLSIVLLFSIVSLFY